MLRLHRAAYLLPLLLASTTAQVLTSGNGQLPTCAQTCSNLVRAAQACGGNAGTSTTIWSCFCQSAYITPFENNPAGVCTDTCTSASDNQNVMQWYKTNCGSDYGASEHGAGGTTTVVSTSTSATAAGGQQTASSASAASATSTSGADVQGQGAAQTQQEGSWWSTHYKWVIMLIVLFIALLALALLAIWLKKRHQRKQDQVKSSFNEGITTRSAPSGAALDSPMKQVDRAAVSGPYAQSASVLESGRNSPARTRDAFMPYGYGYARSESRTGSRGNLPEDAIQRAGSPLARAQTPGEGAVAGKSAEAGKKRRVLVRERSAATDDGGEGK